MKKVFTVLAMAALLVGCVKENSYDDSFVLEKLSNLEQRVTALESSIASVQSTLGSGKFVQKVEELKDSETGKTVGITVTYTTGEVVNFTISKITDPDAAPVLSVMMNGAGELCWAIDGAILTIDGKEVPVYKTPAFAIKEGHLFVTVDGVQTDLGNVKGEKGEQGEQGEQGEPGKDGEIPVVQDGLIKDLQVTDEAVIITYGEDLTVSIPLATAFELVFEKTEYVITSAEAFEIPFTVKNATAKTVVDVFACDSDFQCKIKDGKIIVKPLKADAAGSILVFADSKTGLTSIVKLTVEGEICAVTDESVDYAAESEDAVVEVNVVSNVEFEVKPQDEWIKVSGVKAQDYVITLVLDDNTSAEPRTGSVKIVRKGTDEALQTITVAQKGNDGYTNVGKAETANCYIVSAAGKYKFPAVKGNSAESVGTVASVGIVWETWNNMESVTANSIVASAECDGNMIKFETPATFHTGNALIAAKDAEGVILWSWHIWATDKTIEGIDCGYAGEALVMNYNLGATGELGTSESFGLQYQWGRKDPFVGGGNLGHSDFAESVGTEMTVTTDRLTEDQARQNPTLFYKVDQNGKDWFAGDASDRWSEEKSINDPCPAGWRVARSTDNQIFLLPAGTTVNTDNYTFTAGSAVFPFSGTIYYESAKIDKSDTIYHLADDWNTTTPKGWRVKSSSGSRIAVRKASGGAVRCVVITAE